MLRITYNYIIVATFAPNLNPIIALFTGSGHFHVRGLGLRVLFGSASGYGVKLGALGWRGEG